MITATLQLTRTLNDGASGYRKYFLIADFGSASSQGKASIVPLSSGAPMPESDQIQVPGGENEALMAAAELLRKLPANEGFTALVDLGPSQ